MRVFFARICIRRIFLMLGKNKLRSSFVLLSLILIGRGILWKIILMKIFVLTDSKGGIYNMTCLTI